MNLSNNPNITFKAAVKLHADFWENPMNHIEIANNFEINFMKNLRFDIAYEYGLEVAIAESVVTTLNLKSLAELDDRYLGHYSVYNNTYELEHDIYEVHGRNIPYRIVHNLIVADKPL